MGMTSKLRGHRLIEINWPEFGLAARPLPSISELEAFGGRLDRTVPLAHIGGWCDQTPSSFTQILIDEDHLYLLYVQSAREHLTGYIRGTLQASACQR